MITVKAPGKLYIAGEYAVVEPGHSAILVAVNQFIKVTAEPTTVGTIISDQLNQSAVHWHRDHDQIIFNESIEQLSYVQTALELTEDYIGQQAYPPMNYQINITSQLDSQNGRKYGLGSSAAVTVAVVKAILKLYHLYPPLLTIFKLAATAHLKVQGNGSLGDVAASVYGGWIAYRSLDRKWLKKQTERISINELVEKPWPSLKIERLIPPKRLKLMIGWTGSPASTVHLLKKVANNHQISKNSYYQFLRGSQQCVTQMIDAFHHQNLAAIETQINMNRQLLNQFATNAGIEIETTLLKQMCNIADQYGGAAKSSGAGGGDCGIAIIDRTVNINQIVTDWQQVGIKNLSLTVSYNQQEEVNDQPSLTPQK